jgi:putative membrane protein
MRNESANPDNRDPRIVFAAERTLLAWIRTGLAMMGFGFVVARFGLFLRELALSRDVTLPRPGGVSQWVGVVLIALGVVVHVFAGLQHFRFVQRFNRGEVPKARAVSMGVVLSAVLAALGLGLAGYLLWLR